MIFNHNNNTIPYFETTKWNVLKQIYFHLSEQTDDKYWQKYKEYEGKGHKADIILSLTDNFRQACATFIFRGKAGLN